MSKAVYVDKTIYRKESKQFPNVQYRFSLSNVVIHSMYTMYLKSRGIPKTIGLTDKQRFDFEKLHSISYRQWVYRSDRSRSRNERKMKMSTIGIILLSIATLIVADIVMYIVLGAIEKHWEKKFKEDKDDER